MVPLGDTAISLHILQPALWGVFWVRSDLESRKKVRVFNWGGGFWVRSDLESRKKVRVFQFGRGVFWVRSDLESRKEVRVFQFWGGGGVLGQVRFGI